MKMPLIGGACVVAVIAALFSLAVVGRVTRAERPVDVVNTSLADMLSEFEKAERDAPAMLAYQKKWTGRWVCINGWLEEVIPRGDNGGAYRISHRDLGAGGDHDHVESFLATSKWFDIDAPVGGDVAVEAKVHEVNPLGPLFVDARLVMIGYPTPKIVKSKE